LRREETAGLFGAAQAGGHDVFEDDVEAGLNAAEREVEPCVAGADDGDALHGAGYFEASAASTDS